MNYLEQLLSASWAEPSWFLGLIPAFIIMLWFVVRGKEKVLPALIRLAVIALSLIHI